MPESFRDILDLFPDRSVLATHWDKKVPAPYKVTVEAVNMWHHRDGIPSWAWTGFEAAARVLKTPEVTFKRIAAADIEARRRRAESRRDPDKSPKSQARAS